MSHLSLETLARLVDEAPTPIELAHLGLCAACRQDLEDLRADATALASLPALVPPPTAWPALEDRLAREGLLRRPARAPTRGALLQLAAGIVLFVVGTGFGAFVLAAGEPGRVAQPLAAGSDATAAGDIETVRQPAVTAGSTAAFDTPQATTPVEPPASAGAPSREPRVVPQSRARTDAVRFAATPPASPRNAEEALAFMRSAESAYLEALTHYAEMAGGFEGGDPAARLAALEGIMLTTRAALGVAPADPIINGYHMTALAQRDATLRQIALTSSQTWF